MLDGLRIDAKALAILPMCTFINPVELDSLFAKLCLATRWSKRMFELAKNLLWITQALELISLITWLVLPSAMPCGPVWSLQQDLRWEHTSMRRSGP